MPHNRPLCHLSRDSKFLFFCNLHLFRFGSVCQKTVLSRPCQKKKATLQVLEAFRPLIAYRAYRGVGHRAALYEQLLRAIAVHRVADRPDRFEPRMAKRRPKRYDRLTRPRAEIKLRMLKRVSEI